MTGDNPSGSTDDDRRADEEAIHALLDRQITAWDAGDPDAYAGVYTLDGDCVSFLGAHYSGRAAIIDSCEVPRRSSLFRKLARGAHLDFRVTKIRFLTADVALVHAVGGVTAGSGPSRRSMRTNTSVAVRTDDGWRLAASHNSSQRPLAEKLLSKLVSPQH
jgi:uncharacterized protein (TIGR02246 family)